MERVDAVGDNSALRDEERGLSIGAAASGEDRVFEGVAGVGWDDGVETEGYGRGLVAMFVGMGRGTGTYIR